MLRVLHIISKFSPQMWGGAETAIVETSKRLRQMGTACAVYSTRAFSPEACSVVEGIPVRRFRQFHLPDPRVGLSQRARQTFARKGGAGLSPGLLWSLLRQRDTDLVHLHVHNKLSTTAAWVCRARGLPYVVTIHSPYAAVDGWLRRTFSYESSLRHAHRIMCVGPAEYETVRANHGADRVEWIPNGVDLDRFSRGDGSRFRRRHGLGTAPVILCVGNIYPIKNQLMLLEAVEGMLAQVPGLRVVLIGNPIDPVYFETIQRKAGHQAWRGRLLIIPGLPPGSEELVDAYDACDAAVVPSIAEAQGLVVLEAWAAGKPVVASRVGGLAHTITDGVTGYTVQVDQRAPENLARTLIFLLRNPGVARQLGEHGQRIAQMEYSWDEVARKIDRVYRKVVEDHAAR